MNFGQALTLLRAGQKVTRKGWNGKGMWLRLYDPQTDKEYPVVEKGPSDCTPLPWIGMKTADNKFIPWLASQTDMLADDWMVMVPQRPAPETFEEPPSRAHQAFQPTMPSEPVPLDDSPSPEIRTYAHDQDLGVKARGAVPVFRHFKAHEDEVLSCDWCGSISPKDLARLIRTQGLRLQAADQKYGWPHKFYLAPHVLHAPVKFYTVHLDDANEADRLVIEKEMGYHFEFKQAGPRKDVRWWQFGTKKREG